MEEVTINGVALSEYGATMVAGSYAALIKPPQLKEWVSNDSPGLNGTEYIAPASPKVKEREVSLVFALKGDTKEEFASRYTSFISVLLGGITTLYVPDLGKYYHLKYEACTSFDNYSLTACKLAVKFVEPDPTNNSQ